MSGPDCGARAVVVRVVRHEGGESRSAQCVNGLTQLVAGFRRHVDGREVHSRNVPRRVTLVASEERERVAAALVPVVIDGHERRRQRYGRLRRVAVDVSPHVLGAESGAGQQAGRGDLHEVRLRDVDGRVSDEVDRLVEVGKVAVEVQRGRSKGPLYEPLAEDHVSETVLRRSEPVAGFVAGVQPRVNLVLGHDGGDGSRHVVAHLAAGNDVGDGAHAEVDAGHGGGVIDGFDLVSVEIAGPETGVLPHGELALSVFAQRWVEVR